MTYPKRADGRRFSNGQKKTALTAKWASKFLCFVPHPILFFLSSNSTRRGNSILLFELDLPFRFWCVCVCVFQTILFIHFTMIVVLQFLSFREKETLNSHTHNKERERCVRPSIKLCFFLFFFNQFITTHNYTTSTWKRQRRHHNKSISKQTREIDAVHVIIIARKKGWIRSFFWKGAHASFMGKLLLLQSETYKQMWFF